MRSDIIVLTETWLDPEQHKEEYDLQNHSISLNSGSRCKAMQIATYLKDKFKHVQNVITDGNSVTKVAAQEMDVIGVYTPRKRDSKDVIKQISDMIDDEKITVIGGKFIVWVFKQPNCMITKNLNERNFPQTVKQATHII